MKRLEFAAVLEAHISGWPHLHILMRSIWIDQKWISDTMAELADSPVVWIERIDNKARVSGYVAKYCGKAAHKFGTAKRYWFSRGYDLTDRVAFTQMLRPCARWDVQELKLSKYAAMFQEFGWRVIFEGMHRMIAHPP